MCRAMTTAIAGAGLLGGASPAWPNDGFGQLGVGGVVVGKTDDIAMAREVLDVGYDEIVVDYDFINESDHDITTTITFPLPAYDAFPPQSGVTAKGQPSGFEVLVNGKPVTFTTHVAATHAGVDITAKLKAIGFSDQALAVMPFLIDEDLYGRDPLGRAMTEEQAKSLEKMGLMDQWLPRWQLHVAYQWQQLFPAHAAVHVRHRYAPFIAYGTASGWDPAHSVQDNPRFATICLDPGTRRTLDALATVPANLDDHGQVPGTFVDYILETANTWKDGVRDFTLRIHKRDPRELVSLCFPGSFKRVDARTLESHLRGFRPESDLHIYFGNRQDRLAGSKDKEPQFHR